MKKIRVLGIAPYEGMKTLMMNIVGEFPTIELTTYVGDLDSGLAIAEENFHDNYDVVISRGATGTLLQSSLSLPVINVEISMYDMLYALRLVNPTEHNITVVSYTDVENIVRQISNLYSYDIGCYTIPSAKEAELVLTRSKNDGYEIFLCDMIADNTARRLGLNSFLITSGEESIRNAFKEVLKIAEIEKSIRTENKLLRSLFENQIGNTVVFDSKNHLFLSSMEEIDPSILAMLENEIGEMNNEDGRKTIRIRKGIIYSIRSKIITINEIKFTAFFFTERKSTLQLEKTGITYLSPSDVEHSYYNSLFCLSGISEKTRKQIEKLKYSRMPILICGEKGTGKESFAEYIYLNSDLKNNPLVKIDCALLNDRSWDFLMNHSSSPLAVLDQTIFFSNIESLAGYRLSTILVMLNDICANERNRIIISSVTSKNRKLSQVATTFADSLSAITIETTPLRDQKEGIPLLFNKNLSLLNMELPHMLAGISNEAVEILQAYAWPGNFPQFHRIMKDIALTATNTIADKQTIEKAIEKEAYSLSIEISQGSDLIINLHDKLNDIEKAIAIRVLEDEYGNRTAAAKRLGISRTTLWRMIDKT